MDSKGLLTGFLTFTSNYYVYHSLRNLPLMSILSLPTLQVDFQPLVPTTKPQTTLQPAVCLTTTYICPFCSRTSTHPRTLCDDAEIWDCACKTNDALKIFKEIPATCLDGCREKEAELRE